MTKCDYAEVPKCEKSNEIIYEERTNSRIPFIRQALVCSGVWSVFFQCGLIAGTPTVLIPQMRREANSTNFISQEQASWLSSIGVLAAIPWIPVISAMAWYCGRRTTHAFVAASSLVAFAASYFSTAFNQIFISMIFLAINVASLTSSGLMIVTEYTSPENRGFFLTLKSATLYWGIWVANAIGTVCHWRNIQVLGFCCAAYNCLTLLVWPESPYWLASQGRINQCRDSFLWLRGSNKKNETELEYLMNINKSKHIHELQVRDFLKKLGNKTFYKPLILCSLSILQYYLTGKVVVSIYSIDIVKKITNSETKAYAGMLILDGVTVFGMYCGCFLARRLKRRVQLIFGTSGGIVCLILMSIYLHLIKRSFIFENVYVTLSLLSVSMLLISCGPVLIGAVLIGELLPLLHRNFVVYIINTISCSVSGIMAKTGPQLFISFGMDGTFLFYGLTSSLCLIILYKYLPETKDKTLLEISELVIGSKV